MQPSTTPPSSHNHCAKELVGWEHAAAVLPSVVSQIVAARGADEATAWRHPVDLVTLCDETAAELRSLFRTVRRSDCWSDHGSRQRGCPAKRATDWTTFLTDWR